MAETDLYAVLEVPRSADADAIKKAYRALALKFHPDRNQGNKSAEDRFKQINHAYDILSDPKKRALYDEFGEMGLREGFNPEQYRQYQKWAGGHGGRGAEDIFGGVGGNVDMSDLFEQLFQGAGGPRVRGRQQRIPVRGMDLEGEITIDLADALRGAELPITVNNSSLRVRIPAGVHDGARLRIAGKGQQVPSGKSGDLMLTVHVRPHPSFWIEDDDLHVRLPVSLSEAWKGAKVKVPTPTGEVTLRVPPKTNSGTKLRLRHKGVPHGRDGDASDLIVHVEIALPKESPEADALFAQLEKFDLEDPRSELRL